MSIERYGLSWKEDLPALKEVIQTLPEPPKGQEWEPLLTEDSETDQWKSLGQDLSALSLKFPGVLFKMEITNCDEDTRYVQYHRDGLYYEEREVRCLPGFDKSKLKAYQEKQIPEKEGKSYWETHDAMERYGLSWKENLPTLKEVIQNLPDPPEEQEWQLLLTEYSGTDQWNSPERDLSTLSPKFSGVLFKMEITNCDEDVRHVQYHRDGLYYEERELRYLPDFDESKLKAYQEKKAPETE